MTTPPLETVATEVFDDDQAACALTVCVVPLESVAVAANGAVAPIDGADPVTATVETDAAGAVVDEGRAAAGQEETKHAENSQAGDDFKSPGPQFPHLVQSADRSHAGRP